MICTQGLVKRAGDKTILQGIDLEINRGETVAILGSNGAGKSTLLKIFALLSKPTYGELKIDNMAVRDHEAHIKRMIGYLPHSSMLYDHFSPMENLIYYGSLYAVENANEKADALLEEVGLSLFRHEPVKNFSRGMQQRLAVARAIIHSPRLLLLDEPHTGLDQQAIMLLNKVIVRMKEKGVTTLMVTHDFKMAAEVCDRIIILQNSCVAEDFQLKNESQSDIEEKYSKIVAVP
ncbi:heme ABC exporter ATP-binding protein CcmA [Paenibacillus sp. Dod16]|uniref:heme ABC exporter ATP-binding protein CcmA n=1 Tax=Paenibacillus sp. Dod16 TaxID=3416392 RepID=UPI003CEE32EF